ncbi:hypothetical protein [Myroides sp.]|uniref:hypothetical protein n=1 Tax=Myroides sp. TaxID=1874736 RepID=UPI0028B17F7C|nr:hypothetical protein [Myroides sp.]
MNKLIHYIKHSLYCLFVLSSLFSYGQSLYPVNSANSNSIFVSLTRFNLTDQQQKTLQQHLPKTESLEPISLPKELNNIILKASEYTSNDKIFYYNYVTNKLLTWNVNDAQLIALQDPYLDGFDYGLMITDDALAPYKDNLTSAFIHIGATNPFAQEKLNPIKWTLINKKAYPIPIGFINQLKSHTSSPWTILKTHQYHDNQYDYYLAELTSEDHQYAHFFTITKKNSDIVHYYKLSISSEENYLNTVNTGSENDVKIHIGKLIKNKPLAFWGLSDTSIGCSSIYFIDYDEIVMSCINNH